MDTIDLRKVAVSEKHDLIFNKVKNLQAGDILNVRSEQDLIILQSHIIEEIGEDFDWKHKAIDDDLYELEIKKL